MKEASLRIFPPAANERYISGFVALARLPAAAPARAMPFVTEVPGQLSQLDQADDIPTASQSTLLLQKKKEMAEVQQQLDRKKEEFRMRMQECQEKEMELAGKQEQLKEGVRKFEKFLKENDAKRIRANRKAVEEIKLKELKESEKQERTKELEVQEKKRNELQHELRSKQRYEQFLERVCDSTEQFEDIPEVLKRYETLDAANHDLLSRMDEAQTGAEETSRKLQEEMKKTQTSALIVNSDIAKKQKGLKEMRIELQDAEEQMIRQADDAKEGLMELGEINMVTAPRPLAATARAPPPPHLRPASAPPPTPHPALRPPLRDAMARLEGGCARGECVLTPAAPPRHVAGDPQHLLTVREHQDQVQEHRYQGQAAIGWQHGRQGAARAYTDESHRAAGVHAAAPSRHAADGTAFPTHLAHPLHPLQPPPPHLRHLIPSPRTPPSARRTPRPAPLIPHRSPSPL